MVNTEVVSIIIAVLALVGTIANVSLTIWEKRYTERRKRYDALADVVAKYRDPLHLAAEDLSTKIINIQGGLYLWLSEDGSRAHRDYVVMHTAYVFGQFFGWLYILRRDTQFLLPSTRYDEESGTVRTILHNIRMTLRSSSDDSLFMILTGEQEAMGELMTVVDGSDPDERERNGGEGAKSSVGQCRCMGYATFVKTWKRDPEFREWFGHIVTGLTELNRLAPDPATSSGAHLPDKRLRSLQHQLVDLIECLDPRGLHSKAVSRCAVPAPRCACKACKAKREAERPVQRRANTFEVP